MMLRYWMVESLYHGKYIMIKKIIPWLAIFVLISPGYAADSEGATILDHKSWISGGNEEGAAISGHIEKNESVEQSGPQSSSSTTASTNNASGDSSSYARDTATISIRK